MPIEHNENWEQRALEAERKLKVAQQSERVWYARAQRLVSLLLRSATAAQDAVANARNADAGLQPLFEAEEQAFTHEREEASRVRGQLDPYDTYEPT